ncbi:MAG: chorismate synthase, partial [Thermodesulfobacteriota bacterium]|nr:chorismate synthase [Thermodesulfobacteriota bacterium]
SYPKKTEQLFRIRIYSYGIEIGDVKACNTMRGKGLCADASDLRCLDPEAEIAMKDCIDKAHTEGDTLGGIFEVVAEGVPVGLGSHTHWDRKLDTRLSAALMSIQAIKGVEIGMGFDVARHPGSQVHDEIFYGRKGSSKKSTFYRKTNRAGGIEGGTSNGEDIILRAAMKPISTLRKPLRSVDIDTKDELTAIVERSDVCAVPACSVIGEAVVAFEIARAFVEKFGGDSIEEIQRNYDSYMKYLDRF